MTSKNFEEKIEKAKKNLESLMNPEITLSDSVKLYKEGIKELKDAQKLLENAKIEYEELKSEGSTS